MAFIDELEECLKNKEFSMEMLNNCRMCFQYGGFNEDDCERFKEMLSQKIRTSFPNLDPKIDEILAQLCIDRGVLEIKDVIFVDGAVYSEKENEDNYRYIDFIGSTTSFTQSAFDYLAQSLNKGQVNKEVINRLAKSMREIFEEYFSNPNFPTTLDWEEIREWPSFPWITFALSCDEDELASLCKKNDEFTFKIANRIKGTTNCRVLELAFSANKEKALKVVSTTDEVVRLSSILANKENNKKRTLNT